MADSSIYDDFEEPASMSKAFCEQVSAQEYSDNVTTETDKALGELCLLLDKKPELYSRVLRKRKREEIESDGVFSFMKSKVLGLVQGDEYTENLVSDAECSRQTNALKAGICRTFQYAQEIKIEPVRHSQRQASKVATQRIEKGRPHRKKAGENSNSNTSRTGAQKIGHSDCGDGQSISKVDQSNKKNLDISNNNNKDDKGAFVEISLSSDEDDTTRKTLSADGEEVSSENSRNCDSSEHLIAEKQIDSEPVPPPPGPPPPPPPPPLPALLPVRVAPNIRQHLTPTVKKLTDSFLTPSQGTPDALQTISDSDMNSSTTSSIDLGCRPRNGIRSFQSKSDIALSNTTPDNVGVAGRTLRSQKHSGSVASLSNIHSELITSNPVSRLRVTQIVRSPGGTPARPSNASRLPSEPLHKALVTAVRSKFKNVHTPSPRSARSSVNNSGNFTFTP